MLGGVLHDAANVNVESSDAQSSRGISNVNCHATVNMKHEVETPSEVCAACGAVKPCNKGRVRRQEDEVCTWQALVPQLFQPVIVNSKGGKL